MAKLPLRIKDIEESISGPITQSNYVFPVDDLSDDTTKKISSQKLFDDLSSELGSSTSSPDAIIRSNNSGVIDSSYLVGTFVTPNQISLIPEPDKIPLASESGTIDREWLPANSQIPPGGGVGRVLTKLSGQDYDVAWADINSSGNDNNENTTAFGNNGGRISRSNKTISSNGTGIAIIGLINTVSDTLAHVYTDIEVRWWDTTAPKGMGISKLTALFYRYEGPTYDESIDVYHSVILGNDLTGTPSFSFSRTSDSWVLVMEPVDGNLTADINMTFSYLITNGGTASIVLT